MANQKRESSELHDLLRRAAQLAAERGVGLDAFMSAAWRSYLDASPGLREQLEEARLTAEIGQLRESGKIARA